VERILYYQYFFEIIFLGISGAVAAKIAGSNVFKSVMRICLWGTMKLFRQANHF
jgi:vacuolar iron transporter family protein